MLSSFVTWKESYRLIHARARFSRISLTPLIFLTDADTTQERRVTEIRLNLEEVTSLNASRKRFRIIPAVPALCRCLFLDEDAMHAVFGAELTSERLIRSRFEPAQVLAELLASQQKTLNEETIVALAMSLDATRLRQFPAIEEVLQFVETANQLVEV